MSIKIFWTSKKLFSPRTLGKWSNLTFACFWNGWFNHQVGVPCIQPWYFELCIMSDVRDPFRWKILEVDGVSLCSASYMASWCEKRRWPFPQRGEWTLLLVMGLFHPYKIGYHNLGCWWSQVVVMVLWNGSFTGFLSLRSRTGIKSPYLKRLWWCTHFGRKVPYFFDLFVGWKSQSFMNLGLLTLPETKSLHLKMDGCNTSFRLGWPIFRGYVWVCLVDGFQKFWGKGWKGWCSPLWGIV